MKHKKLAGAVLLLLVGVVSLSNFKWYVYLSIGILLLGYVFVFVDEPFSVIKRAAVILPLGLLVFIVNIAGGRNVNVWYVASLFLKATDSVFMVVIFFSRVPAHSFFSRRPGVPFLIIIFIYRYFFLFYEVLRTSLMALRARGEVKGWKHLITSPRMAYSTFNRAIERGERMSRVMIMRGLTDAY